MNDNINSSGIVAPPVTSLITVNESAALSGCDRMPGESLRAFNAARIYCELNAARSLVLVAEKTGKSKSLISRWAPKWRWVERARAWDEVRCNEREVELNKAMTAAAEAVAKKWEVRALELRELKYRTGIAGLNKVNRMLEFPLAEVEKTESVSPDSLITRKTIVKPVKWNFNTTARMTKEFFALTEAACQNDAVADEDRQERDVNWMIEDYTTKTD